MTDADRVLVLQLDKSGLTQAQIAQQLGFTQQAISLWLTQCRDTTVESTLYLRGQALRMSRNIVEKGKASEHVQALKGLSVLKDEQQSGVTVIVGGGGTVNVGIGLSPGLSLSQGEGEPIPQQIGAGSDN